ncbi:MAG: cytochrome C oxidase subunit IV family protein [Polyangiaceae bacterium]|nr:cytochrome C oxidase subunit IV family protein [Polyangiaceae bacterium]
MANQHHEEDKYNVVPHVSSIQMNLVVLGALLFLTGLTVAAYRVHLGEWNLLVAVLIASVKSVLVGTFFMHLKWERGFNTLFFVGSLLFVGLFLAYTVNDTHHRGQVDPNWGNRQDPRTRAYAAGTAQGIEEAGGDTSPMPTPATGEAAGEH